MGVAEVFTEFGDIYLQSVISTWLMTAVCFAGGLTLGIIITVLRVSPIKPLRTVGDVYVQLFRNIPTVSLLVIFVYALPYLGATLPYRTCLLACVILIVSAFASENFMSGINAIGVGQIEAGYALGLTKRQVLFHVIIPPAFKVMLPALFNQFIISVKDTAMLSIISVNEITRQTQNYVARTYNTIPAYTMCAVFYLVLLSALMILQHVVEQRLKK